MIGDSADSASITTKPWRVWFHHRHQTVTAWRGVRRQGCSDCGLWPWRCSATGDLSPTPGSLGWTNRWLQHRPLGPFLVRKRQEDDGSYGECCLTKWHSVATTLAVTNYKLTWEMKHLEMWLKSNFRPNDSLLHIYIYNIWVNYNDLTATSLGIMVSKGNYLQMALIQVSEIL